jgi:hypothetical protein
MGASYAPLEEEQENNFKDEEKTDHMKEKYRSST